MSFFEWLQKHITKSVCLGSPNKGSDCEGKILAYKKNKLSLISILYIKNTNEECLTHELLIIGNSYLNHSLTAQESDLLLFNSDHGCLN